MLWKLYKIHLIVLVPILIFFTYNLSKLIKNSLKEYNLKYKILALPLVMLFLMIGARSSFDSSTPNQGYYTFSSSNIKNEIANNSIFSILYATYLLKKEKFYEYGEISSEKAIANINKINDFSTFDQNSLLRFQKSTYSEKKNIILIILESFGNDHVGYLGGTNTTPNLDSLTNESLYFTNLYATGARTSWGLSSILTSLYPIPSREYIKAAKSQKEFYTIAKTLKKHGYENTFIFPGDADFDNMRGFFLSNGYDKVLGKENFNRTKHLKYTWGYCDEALYEKAIDQIEKYKDKDKPFFLTMLTISSHEPFDYPKGRVKPYKNAKLEGFANSIKYADHSLGKFIVELKKKGLMENTVVAIIADHCNDANGEFDVPINRYKIPALILSEDFKKKRGVKYNKIASQIDFAPTILDVAGVSDYIPTVGSSILQNQRNSAILLAKRKNFAYLLQDSFIVYTGDSNIQTYNYKFKKIKNINKDVINGLSYIYGSKYLYDNKILYN
ncbi:MAG: LTA synthase family protein [Desulfobacterales bacterium]|nr:LTA synthase family protein [Desulfobacterales bacterium]MCP4161074.1 LTA synthase family protein [Deltaproteobacteria bacterium]